MFRPEASSPWPGQGQGLGWLLTPRNLELGAALPCLGAPIPCLGAPLPCMMPNRNGIWPQEHLNSQHLPSRCPALPRKPLSPAVDPAVRGSSQSLSHLGGSQDPSGSWAVPESHPEREFRSHIPGQELLLTPWLCWVQDPRRLNQLPEGRRGPFPRPAPWRMW